ncbi:TPA: hypothetical protein LU108_001726 [Enterobacter hormaechei subsp. xiangfangensis]|nr:hypothetical protein [Enterobacter hormaechei subsp. xiangfangensis]
MPMKRRIFSYKIVRDFGFAPNPFHDYCTLATCKPKIRNSAQPGDLIFGCGSSHLNLKDKLIYVMLVEEKMSFQEYWEDQRFKYKKPHFYSNKQNAFGDNIYHVDSNGNWTQEDSHHSFEDGRINQDNMERDLTSLHVLISTNFIYFGDNFIDVPIFPTTGEKIYPNSRAYITNFSDEMVNQAYDWFINYPHKGCIGSPISWI